MRLTALVLTLLYAATATPVAVLAAAPRVKTVAKADFACAKHGCACKTAEQCHRHCCCELRRRPVVREHCHLPQRAARAEAPKPVKVRVTALAALECSGAPTPATASGTAMKPHLPAPAAAFSALMDVTALPRDAMRDPAAVVPDHPDKVPI